MTNPNGLSLRDIEKTVEIHEGKYFDRSEAQHCIVDCMLFKTKSLIEQRDITKFLSFRNDPPFWNFKDGKYFLSDDKFRINDEEKNILEESRKYSEMFKKHEYLTRLISIIETLTNNPLGVSFNELYNSFLDFNKKFGVFKELTNEYNLDENTLIEESFIQAMNFDYTEPYDSVYLDKKEDSPKNSRVFAYEPFIDWEYRKGLYYPTEEWLKKNEEGIKKSERAIKSLVNKLEDKTLLNQVNQHCILKEKTNNDFLRMHLFMQANLERSRSS
ncbi:MAG: hypothetical protein AABW81_02860 [Nanoarchaeota archaeon]